MLAGPSRWGQAPGRSTAHGRCLAGPVDPVRIPPLALDPYLVEQRYHRQHLRIFGVSNFVILDACLRPTHCWGVLAGLCDEVQHGKAAELSTACAARGRGAPRGGGAWLAARVQTGEKRGRNGGLSTP